MRPFDAELSGNGGDDEIVLGYANALVDGGEDNDTFEIRVERHDLVDEAIAAGYQNASLAGLPSQQRATIIGGMGQDTVNYTQAPNGIELDLSFTPNVEPEAQQRAGGAFFQLESDETQNIIEGVERINLSGAEDTISFTDLQTPGLATAATISGEDGGAAAGQQAFDTLDFSSATGSVIIGDADGGATGVEVYGAYNAGAGQFVNRFLTITFEATSYATMDDPTGLRFTNFEEVIGSDHDDALWLTHLNPAGELSATDRQTIDTLLSTVIPLGNDPVALAAQLQALGDQAALIPQNQQEVRIDGGAGDDGIRGTETGVNYIYGGDGDDQLIAGGFRSELHGGDGTDILRGGGFESALYGGAGDDIFDLTNNTFVMDADFGDHVFWDGMRISGGVQLSWSQTGWAHWSPFFSLMSAAPLPFLSSFVGGLGAVGFVFEAYASATFRFAMTDGDQLIIQRGLGRGGQAIIDGYDNDIAAAQASGNVYVARQVISTGGPLSFADLKAQIDYLLRAGWGVGFTGIDPLILDLDGDGIETSRVVSSGVHFDLDGDGFAERAAWVTGDDGFLARDLNGNGVIDDIGELFGDAGTPGFDALSALDSNSDGVIDASDADFADLRVWHDADGDGVTDAGELLTLAEAGIASISLATTAPADGALRGGDVRAEGAFTRTDGSTGLIADVVLDARQEDSVHLGDNTISAAAAALPGLRGRGDMVDLRVAMTDDATLLQMVTDFSALPAGTTFEAMRADVVDILLRWAGAEGIAATPFGNGVFDEQRLAFLETYAGQELAPRYADGSLSGNSAAELAESFDAIVSGLTVRLAIQGPLAGVLQPAPFDVAYDRFLAPSVSSLGDTLAAAIGELSSNPTTAEAEWSGFWGPMLAQYAALMIRHDGYAVEPGFVVQSLVRAVEQVAGPLSVSQLVDGLGLDGVHVGTAGNDMLVRVDGNVTQVFVGDAGNDTLEGGAGQDIYVFGTGFGQDVIIDDDGGPMPRGDRLRFATLSSDEVTMTRVGLDLVISVNGTTDTVTVKDHFQIVQVAWSGFPISANRTIEEIQFADGRVMDTVDIAAAVGVGTHASEVLQGTGTQDILEGLGGDDTLIGGDDGDTYFYAIGDGHDVIQDFQTNPLISAADALYLLNARQDKVVLTRDGDSDDITIGFEGTTSDSVTIEGQFYYNATGFGTNVALNNRVENILFADGGWNWVDLQTATILTYTTTGDDITYGFGTPDEFFASAGNDTLTGFDGGDTYRFGIGSGQDTIEDNSRYPASAFGNFIGFNWNDTDILRFEAGISAADVTFSRLSDAPDLTISIAGVPDTMTVIGQFAGQRIDLFNYFGIVWWDRIEEFHFDDGTVLTWQDVLQIITTGTPGNDSLYGAFYSDTLDGGAGDDYLSGENEGDVYIFGRGYGSDTIEDNRTTILTDAVDTLRFTSDVAVGDVVFERDGATLDLIVRITGTSDVLRIVNQYDVTETGVFGPHAWDAVERFEWSDGTVLTWPQVAQLVIDQSVTPGDDTVLGSHGADTITGGSGNDTLSGWNGSDTYLFGRGDGQDVVIDAADDALATYNDRVLFDADVAPADIDVLRGSDNDIVLRIRDTGETLTLRDAYEPSLIGFTANRIETVEFADGTIWDRAEVAARAISFQETATDDTVTGFYTDDTLDGGTGNDLLDAGTGSDTYLYNLGDGNDTIDEESLTRGEVDVLEFGSGIAVSDVTLSRSTDGLSLILSIASGGSVTVTDHFERDPVFGMTHGIEAVRFADGTTWSREDIRVILIDAAQTSGNDTIDGFQASDIIDGGTGDDLLRGGGGGDIYRFGFGSGQDTIAEPIGDLLIAPGRDVVEFGTGVSRSDVTFTRVGEDLVATLTGGNDILIIRDHFVAPGIGPTGEIELFRFADGTFLTAAEAEANAPGSNSTIDEMIEGTAADDTLDGGAGTDTLEGGGGSDTYLFGSGYGHDRIHDVTPTPIPVSSDTVQFEAGLDPSTLTFTRSGDDLVISASGGADSLTITGQFATPALGFRPTEIETFIFGDGTIWTADDMRSALLASESTSSNDVVTGFFSDDTIEAGAGNDTLVGGDGNDTYLWSPGDGNDVIREVVGYSAADEFDRLTLGPGVGPDDVVLSRPAGTDDLLVTITSTGETVLVENQFAPFGFNASRTDIEEIVFDNGLVWSADVIRETLLAGAATMGDDEITGFYTNDTLDGGAGNDTLEGGDGDDVYLFGRGSGQDTIEDRLVDHLFFSEDGDTIVFGPDIVPDDVRFSRSGSDLVISILDTTDTLIVRDHFASGASIFTEIEHFQFSDGTLLGKVDVAALVVIDQSTDGNDLIIGSNEADLLFNTAGDDELSGGRGADIYLFDRGSGHDVIEENGDAPGTKVDEVHFGPDISPTDLVLLRFGQDIIIQIAGTDDSLTLRNQSPSIAIAGAMLMDQVERFVFADGTVWTPSDLEAQVIAAAQSLGDDTVIGSYHADTLDGGRGDDLLIGGLGSDVYVFGRDYGSDRIDDSAFFSTDPDVVRFKDGFSPGDIEVSSSGNDLVLSITGTQDVLRIVNQFADGITGSSRDRIDSFEFTDGTVWTAQDVADMALGSVTANVVTGTTGNDILNGTSDVDIMQGLAGNDTLKGSHGSDIYEYTSGDGSDVIDEFGTAGDIDRLFLTDLDEDDVTFFRQSPNFNDLVAEVSATGQRITIDDQYFDDRFGVEEVEFADGTIVSMADIAAAAPYVGTTGNETINASTAANTISGGLGNDTLRGSQGSDTYLYSSGDGNDLIDEFGLAGDTDKLLLTDLTIGDVSFSRPLANANDLTITVNATGHTITIDDQFLNSQFAIEVLEFANGTQLLTADLAAAAAVTGTAANNTLNGTAYAETLNGLSGNDIFYGKAGDDTFLFEGSFGLDEIRDFGTGDDIIAFSTSLFADFAAVQAAMTQSGGNVVITFDTGNAVTIKYASIGDFTAGDFAFV